MEDIPHLDFSGYDFHPIIMDESSEITGSFHFANKASLQAHFILVETIQIAELGNR